MEGGCYWRRWRICRCCARVYRWADWHCYWRCIGRLYWRLAVRRQVADKGRRACAFGAGWRFCRPAIRVPEEKRRAVRLQQKAHPLQRLGRRNGCRPARGLRRHGGYGRRPVRVAELQRGRGVTRRPATGPDTDQHQRQDRRRDPGCYRRVVRLRCRCHDRRA